MTTVINNPGDNSGDSSGAGVVIGVVLAVVLGGLFLLYLLPMMRNQATPTPTTSTEIKVNLPEAPAKPSTPDPVPAAQ